MRLPQILNRQIAKGAVDDRPHPFRRKVQSVIQVAQQARHNSCCINRKSRNLAGLFPLGDPIRVPSALTIVAERAVFFELRYPPAPPRGGRRP